MPGPTVFLFCLLSFLLGVLGGLVLLKNQLFLLGFLFLLVLAIALVFKKLKWLVIFCLMFFVLGFLRAGFAQSKIAGSKLQGFIGKEVVLEGVLVKEPEISQENQKLIIKLERISDGLTLREFGEEAKVLVYAPAQPQYQYGDNLRVEGLLEEPPIFADFNYKQYLARRGIYSTMFLPEIKVLESGRGNRFYKQVLEIKSKLRQSIEQGFSSQQSLLLSAMILGDKKRLSDEIKDKLNRAGIRHLTAISGMHITILVNLLMLVFIGLGLWRKQAFFLTFVFILFFVVLTGFQASTIRAAIMGFFLLLGRVLGRAGDSTRAILLGAGLMLAFNPFFLFEAGFQLSFLAVLGINYLQPIISSWLKKLPNYFQMKSILAMSLSAQIFTLPILLYHFGQISLVAPITNLLILPFLPLIIALGFLAALLGVFSHALALILVFPCWLLLFYMLKIAEIFSGFLYSSISIRITFLWLMIFYLIFGLFIWRWQKLHPFKILGF